MRLTTVPLKPVAALKDWAASMEFVRFVHLGQLLPLTATPARHARPIKF